MTNNELNRTIQYVTACTSYGRDAVAEIVKTGLGELADLAASRRAGFDRASLVEYVCRWTMHKTGQPETIVR